MKMAGFLVRYNRQSPQTRFANVVIRCASDRHYCLSANFREDSRGIRELGQSR